MEQSLYSRFALDSLALQMPSPFVPAHMQTLPDVPEDKAMDAMPTTRKCATCPVLFDLDPEKDWAKQCYDCFRDDSTRRQCTVCLKHRILPGEDFEWQKICSTCYKDSPVRPCGGCGEPKLKAVEPWRQLCKECWPKRFELLRICTQCGDLPIRKGAESWVKICMKCYMANKEKYFEACPSCKSTKLIKRKTAPACRDCMRSQGLIACAQKVPLMSTA